MSSCDKKDKVVTINVGGTKFQTLKRTIMKEWDSYLARLLRGDTHQVIDPQGCYFVDRSPKYFEYVLNYLRYDGDVVFPDDDPRAMAEIRREFVFYQVTLPNDDDT